MTSLSFWGPELPLPPDAYRLTADDDGCGVSRTEDPYGVPRDQLTWVATTFDGDELERRPADGETSYRAPRWGRWVVLQARDGSADVDVSNRVEVNC